MRRRSLMQMLGLAVAPPLPVAAPSQRVRAGLVFVNTIRADQITANSITASKIAIAPPGELLAEHIRQVVRDETMQQLARNPIVRGISCDPPAPEAPPMT